MFGLKSDIGAYPLFDIQSLSIIAHIHTYQQFREPIVYMT